MTASFIRIDLLDMNYGQPIKIGSDQFKFSMPSPMAKLGTCFFLLVGWVSSEVIPLEGNCIPRFFILFSSLHFIPFPVFSDHSPSNLQNRTCQQYCLTTKSLFIESKTSFYNINTAYNQSIN
jgi:hypothetical protein